ncbi:MAG: TerC family protein [Thermodesulfobacteriota bacterium]
MFDLSWLNLFGFDSFLPQLLGSAAHGVMEKPPDAIDFGWFGWIAFNWTFFSAVIQIILIDLVLAGDNAVVIAQAVRNLPPKQRKWGIILGAGAAVVLRVICTALVSQMLRIPLLKFVGGLAIFWIAVKLLTQGHEEEHVESASRLMEAIKLIVIADFVMSLDNMLAVGGASGGNIFLLIFGLIVSIPFVVGTSQLLSMLMDKYPVIVTIGAAVLGKVSAELIVTDAWVGGMMKEGVWQPGFISNALFGGQPTPSWFIYTVDVIFIVAVIGLGKYLVKQKKARAEGVAAATLAAQTSKAPKE